MKKISKDLIDSITPYKLMEYLKNNGWFIKYSMDTVKIFTYNSSGCEVTVPLDINVGDYSIRVIEAIEALSHFENRYEIDIIRNINKENTMVNLLQDLSDGNYVLPKITRCDVILNGERIQHSKIELSLSVQDDGRTLKVFIDSHLEEYWDATQNVDIKEPSLDREKFINKILSDLEIFKKRK